MSKINLLLVDDEEQFLSTTKKLFEKRGVNTSTATNGLDALKIMEKQPIDVVLLDVKMPKMTGIEALIKIKEKYPLVEVILITGVNTVESVMEALRPGVFDYVMKPCDIISMSRKVEEAYAKKQAMEKKTAAKK